MTFDDEASIPAEIRQAWLNARTRLGRFGQALHYRPSAPSTNDLALESALRGGPEGAVFLAGEQTAGRGRRGHDWFSPPGAGLYVSTFVRPGRSDERSSGGPAEAWVGSRLTIMAGVAAAEGIRRASGLPVELKWPNDLVCGRRKVGGILAEVAGPSSGGAAVVVGIGVNVAPAIYPAAIEARVSSLEDELGHAVDGGLVLVEILSALDTRYTTLKGGDFNAILSAWRHLARPFRGVAIEWDEPSGPVQGEALDVDADGALRARVGGREVRLIAGEVRWHSPSD